MTDPVSAVIRRRQQIGIVELENEVRRLRDALESEHAEVERLRESLSESNDALVYRVTERFREENAHLTTRLQAVRERFSALEERTGGWPQEICEAAAILDASADEPEIDEMTLADREQDERDHAFGWPDLDGANDA